MTTIASLVVQIVGDISEYAKSIKESEEMTETFSSRAVNGLSSLGGSIVMGALATGTAAITGLGVAAWNAGETVDEAMDIMATKTGATGEALEGLQGTFSEVFSQVPAQASTAAEVIAALNSRLGMTGDTLAGTSVQLLNMTNLMGGDATTNAELFSRAMGDWSVPMEDSGLLMDKLFVASQKTGTSVESLMTNIVQFGAPLRNMGFELNDAIALFAKWEKEGVNAELVMGSLRQAAGKFAADNIPLREGLEGTMEAIKGAATNSEALAIAMDIFGARAAGDMSAAIREGRFNIDDLTSALSNAEGAINSTAAATADWPEQWAKLSNAITVNLAPIGDVLRGIAGEAITTMSAFLAKPETQQFIQDLSDKIKDWGEKAGEWLPKIVGWFQDFSTWLGENKGVIAAALAIIGTAILVFAWTSLAGAIPAIIAFGIAWGPTILVLGLIGALAYLLYTAWTENWGGIQEKTAAVWAFLQPIFEKVAEWFKTNIPIAMQALGDFWNNTLLPVFRDIAKWLETNIPLAISALSEFWKTSLLPAFQDVAGWVEAHLFPLFSALGDLLGVTLFSKTVSLSGVFSGVLKTGLDYAAWAIGNLVTILGGLKGILEFIAPYIGDYVVWAFGNLTKIIDKITEGVNWLAEALGKIELPDWMTPGSPTPWENGLVGVRKAMSELTNTTLPNFAAQLDIKPVGGISGMPISSAASRAAAQGMRGASGGGGAGQTVVVNYAPMISAADERELAEKLGPMIVQKMRQYGAI